MYDMSGWNSDIQTNLSLGLFDFPLQYNHIQIYFLILVMQLVGIGFVETVVLLSKGKVDSKKIRVEFSLEDMDMSEFQDGATIRRSRSMCWSIPG